MDDWNAFVLDDEIIRRPTPVTFYSNTNKGTKLQTSARYHFDDQVSDVNPCGTHGTDGCVVMEV